MKVLSMLRGINVSGQRKVPMAELKELYLSLGFTDAVTFIQSGNVVFSVLAYKEAALRKQLEEAIQDRFGFEVPVLLRTEKELKELISQNPFSKEASPQPDKWHVTFLETNPDKSLLEKISSNNYAPDQFRVNGREIYICCPDGYGRTKLNNNFFESKLKQTATTRNWKSTGELLKLML